jgi:hypothetical protein
MNLRANSRWTVSKPWDQAFPQVVPATEENRLVDDFIASGLTKREYFAAMAMQSIISRVNFNEVKRGGDEIALRELVARAAIYQADALLAELSKNPSPQEGALSSDTRNSAGGSAESPTLSKEHS